MSFVRALVVAGATLLTIAPAVAQEPPKKVPAPRSVFLDGQRTLEVVDLTARFLDFYEAARQADAETRWRVWQEKYDFAAVPPTAEGQQLARRLLDDAWPRYPAALAVIKVGAGALEPPPRGVLGKVADLLELDKPFRMQLLVYVGAFDDNAFTFAQDGKPMVAIAVETSDARREVLLAHEMTHAVHMATAGLSGGWERSIAEIIMQEGLAMHASRTLVGGREDRHYVEHEAGWYETANSRSRAILQGIVPELEKSDSQSVFRFTMGTGTTGLEREAYLAGWLVVGELLKQRMTFPRIARIPAADMPGTVRATIERILAAP